MRMSSRLAGLLMVMSWAVFSGPDAAADWPNFRGPRHDGISMETGFKTEWDDAIPLVWERKIGAGFSSFACVASRVYTCGTRDDRQVALCMDAYTGRVIWEHPFERAYPERAGGDGPRATPTVSDGRVYILGARGTMLCMDADTGKELWRKSFGYVPQWGYSGSVLIEGDLAIASAGSADGALVAFDKKTGKQIWKCGSDPAGYATPYPFSFQGKRYIVGFSGDSAIIADARTGRTVWRHPWKTDWDINAASPIVHDGHLFLTSGYKTGCGLFKLTADGDTLKAKEVWKSKVLLNKFQSCILHEGKLYTSDQRALVCVDFLTGKEHWRLPRVKHGTLVLAEGHLLLLTQQGQLQIAKADPAGFKTVSRTNILDGRCWTVPVLHRGRLYVRNLERAACFDMRR